MKRVWSRRPIAVCTKTHTTETRAYFTRAIPGLNVYKEPKELRGYQVMQSHLVFSRNCVHTACRLRKGTWSCVLHLWFIIRLPRQGHEIKLNKIQSIGTLPVTSMQIAKTPIFTVNILTSCAAQHASSSSFPNTITESVHSGIYHDILILITGQSLHSAWLQTAC
jgi:hypothetical protein